LISKEFPMKGNARGEVGSAKHDKGCPDKGWRAALLVDMTGVVYEQLKRKVGLPFFTFIPSVNPVQITY
jgi:hypothetical protein